MNRIARFEKVSKEKFFEGWKDTFETVEEKEMEAIYESLNCRKSDSRKCRI